MSVTCFLLMRRPPSRSTLTATLFPVTTLFRSLRNRASSAAAMLSSVDTFWNSTLPSGLVAHVFNAGSTFERWGATLLCDQLSPVSDSGRSEEHTSELQSLMRISYAVFCLKKKKNNDEQDTTRYHLQTYDRHTNE